MCRGRRKCKPVSKLIKALASIVLNTLSCSNSKGFKKIKKSFIDTTIKICKLIKVNVVHKRVGHPSESATQASRPPKIPKKIKTYRGLDLEI